MKLNVDHIRVTQGLDWDVDDGAGVAYDLIGGKDVLVRTDLRATEPPEDAELAKASCHVLRVTTTSFSGVEIPTGTAEVVTVPAVVTPTASFKEHGWRSDPSRGCEDLARRLLGAGLSSASAGGLPVSPRRQDRRAEDADVRPRHPVVPAHRGRSPLRLPVGPCRTTVSRSAKASRGPTAARSPGQLQDRLSEGGRQKDLLPVDVCPPSDVLRGDGRVPAHDARAERGGDLRLDWKQDAHGWAAGPAVFLRPDRRLHWRLAHRHFGHADGRERMRRTPPPNWRPPTRTRSWPSWTPPTGGIAIVSTSTCCYAARPCLPAGGQVPGQAPDGRRHRREQPKGLGGHLWTHELAHCLGQVGPGDPHACESMLPARGTRRRRRAREEQAGWREQDPPLRVSPW